MNRRERGKEARRQAILKAARGLLRRPGKASLTMQELAEAADVSLMTPYNLFGSKRAIIAAVLDRDLDAFEARLNALEVTSLERIFAVVTLSRSTIDEDEAFYRTAFNEAYTGADLEFRAAFTNPREALWIRLTDRAIRAGYIQASIPTVLIADALQDAYRSNHLRWLTGEYSLRRFELKTLLGQALALLGLATEKGREQLAPLIEKTTQALELDAIDQEPSEQRREA